MSLLILFLLISVFEPSFSKCQDSYMKFCDCVRDLNDHKTKQWTELVIGSEEISHSTTITSYNVRNLNSIRLLFIVNQADSIEPNTFEKIGKTLIFLKLYRNNLTMIKRGTFSGFHKLTMLNLVHNNIKVLETYSFKDSEITDLDLSDNKIQALAPLTFAQAKIKRIIIRRNELSHFESRAFNEKLKVLRLDYNKIAVIVSFFPISKLEELSITHNRLHTFNISSLEHVKKLYFSYNGIRHFDSKQLEELKNLEVLDLSNNELEDFSLKPLKNLTTKLTLLLSYNLLTNLEMEGSKPMILTLFGNPWNCDCLEKMEKAMDHSKVSRTRCDLKLFGAGNVPICLNQGNCTSLPVRNYRDINRFVNTVQQNKFNLSCDLFYDFDV